jgi:transposase-like protein
VKDDGAMPKQYPKEQKDRAIRMLLDRLDDYPSMYAACNAIGPKLGIGSETLRRWTLQAQIDTGQRSGPTSAELAEIKTLKSKVRDLEEANEILKQASIFFARELDPRQR